MPPLCTVGFGLAIRNWEYAAGAMYLFTINTIFIALATFLVLKVLRFPMVRYANSKKRQFIARVASLVAILVMVPAGYTFYKVFKESRFRNQARQLIQETIGEYQFTGNGRYMENLTQVEYSPEGGSHIEVIIMGEELIPEDVIQVWKTRMEQYPELRDTEYNVVQGANTSEGDRFRYVNELYEAKKVELLTKDERIRFLEEELSQMSKLTEGMIPFNEISAEAKANYEGLAGLGFSYTLRTDFNKTDTIPVFDVQWQKGVRKREQRESLERITNWLRVRLKNDRIRVRQVGG
jgi:hypothetical protein